MVKVFAVNLILTLSSIPTPLQHNSKSKGKTSRSFKRVLHWCSIEAHVTLLDSEWIKNQNRSLFSYTCFYCYWCSEQGHFDWQVSWPSQLTQSAYPVASARPHLSYIKSLYWMPLLFCAVGTFNLISWPILQHAALYRLFKKSGVQFW